jgi:hypothetical protein
MGWQDRRAYRRNPAQTLRLILTKCLPAVGRRKEIREILGTLPSVGRLYVNLIFGVQRKTLCGLASLRANFFLFSQNRKGLR